MWRVTADNGQCRCEGYRRGWFASLGFDFGGGLAVLGRGKATGCLVLGWCRGSGGEGQLLTGSQWLSACGRSARSMLLVSDNAAGEFRLDRGTVD